MISVPLEEDAPRTPSEALERAEVDPEVGTLTQHPGDPAWGERFESGRRVAAAKAVEFPRLGGGNGWFVMETAFTAPCGYVNPQHRSDSLPKGFTPGRPDEVATPDEVPGAPVRLEHPDS